MGPRSMTPKREIKERLFKFLCRLGVHHVNRRRNGRRLLIVMYHGLIADGSRHPHSWLLLPVSKFREQIDYLKRFYRVLPVSEAVERMIAGERWRRPTACITFDDGYRNNYTHALPVLERERLPATIYLPTGAIGTSAIHWTIYLERALGQTRANELVLDDFGLGRFTINHGNASAYDCLKSHLYRVDDSMRQKMLHAIFERLAFDKTGDFSGFLPMTWEEARLMQATGLVEFGGHTVRHQITSSLTDEGVREEVCGSMRAIAEKLGTTPRSFAYPNGTEKDFTDTAKNAVRESGGIAALTTVEGLNTINADRFALRRVAVDADMSLDEFKLLTSGLLPSLRSRRFHWAIRGT